MVHDIKRLGGGWQYGPQNKTTVHLKKPLYVVKRAKRDAPRIDFNLFGIAHKADLAKGKGEKFPPFRFFPIFISSRPNYSLIKIQSSRWQKHSSSTESKCNIQTHDENGVLWVHIEFSENSDPCPSTLSIIGMPILLCIFASPSHQRQPLARSREELLLCN